MLVVDALVLRQHERGGLRKAVDGHTDRGGSGGQFIVVMDFMLVSRIQYRIQ